MAKLAQNSKKRQLRVLIDRTVIKRSGKVPMGHHRFAPGSESDESGSHLGTSDEEAWEERTKLNPRRPGGD